MSGVQLTDAVSIAFKLGDGTPAHVTALALPGAVLWDPSGRHRPFKDWVAVSIGEVEPGRDTITELASAALSFLASTLA